MTPPISAPQAARAKAQCTEALSLSFHGLACRVFADSADLLDRLASYYAGLTTGDCADTDVRIFLVNQALDPSNTDWTPMENAKTGSLGLKEAFIDAAGGRWIQKMRTGLVMYQSLADPMVFGDLDANLPQVVNFINNQFLNHHQRQGYLLGHAAAYEAGGQVTAIAAGSGGGKSTLMLRALDAPGTRFLSNDRILLRSDSQGDPERVHVLGLAKHPRVNPGTLLNSERLAPIMPPEQRERYEALSRDELWGIEEKYDVLIPGVYGANKSRLEGRLANLVLLDWSLAEAAPTVLTRVDVNREPEALDGLRKSPGLFFQDADGQFPPQRSASADVYRDRLKGVAVWRLNGQIDFDRAIQQFQKQGLL